MEKHFAVYIMASGKNGTLYVGVTSNLVKRVSEHKSKIIKGFTEKYNAVKLVFYEQHDNAESAIRREKRLKKYKREQKIRLSERQNAEWLDLYDSIL